MDSDVKNLTKGKNKAVDSSLALKKEADIFGNEDEELKSLLLPRRGGISQRPKNQRLKVQWNDRHGRKLAEVLEFQPSDDSDSDEDEGFDSCICTIM